MKQDLALARLVRRVLTITKTKYRNILQNNVSHSCIMNERSILANGLTTTIKVFGLLSAVASCLVSLLKVTGKEHPFINRLPPLY